jgi:hypothetical protein
MHKDNHIFTLRAGWFKLFGTTFYYRFDDHLYFSERYGYRKFIKIGKYIVGYYPKKVLARKGEIRCRCPRTKPGPFLTPPRFKNSCLAHANTFGDTSQAGSAANRISILNLALLGTLLWNT